MSLLRNFGAFLLLVGLTAQVSCGPNQSPSSMYVHRLKNLGKPVPPVPANRTIDEIAEVYNQVIDAITSVTALSKLREELMKNSAEVDCIRNLELVLKSAIPGGQSWAWKYVDAWAKPPPGIMNGNHEWYGDFDECTSIGVQGKDRKFEPHYCRVGFVKTPNETEVPDSLFGYDMSLSIGICVPNSCDAQSLRNIVSALVPKQLGMYVSQRSTVCQIRNPPLDDNAFIAIGLFSALGFVIVVALFVDLVLRFRKWILSWPRGSCYCYKSEDCPIAPYSGLNVPNPRQPPVRTASDYGNTLIGDTEALAASVCDGDSASFHLPNHSSLEHHNIQHQGSPLASPLKHSFELILNKSTNILLCFSPYTNFISIISIPTNQNERTPNLTCLNAIRTISITWVILGHCYAFAIGQYDNVMTIMGWTKRFSFQFILSGIFAVDSFFFLSGFLAYWSLVRHMDMLSMGNKSRFWFWKSLPWVYFHRIIRLLPPYAAIIAIDVCLWRYLSNGPYYFQGTDEACVKSWWSNLLFINNFMDVTDQCVAWGWYLAVDMQLFLFAPFLVALFAWRPRWGFIATALALIGQIVACIAITYSFNIESTVFPPTFFNQSSQMDPVGNAGVMNNFVKIYSKPWCRLAPYVVGVAVAHLVIRHSLCLVSRIFARPWLATIGWLLSGATIVTIIYGEFGIYAGYYTNPTAANAAYNALSRIGWGVALGWIVMACSLNRAGLVGSVMSWPGWAVPARLSYSAYLIHPLIEAFFVQVSRRPFHGTDESMALFFTGILLVAFGVATPFSLVFESPVVSLQRKQL